MCPDERRRFTSTLDNAQRRKLYRTLTADLDETTTPRELDRSADLLKLRDVLTARGYSADVISRFLHGNWGALFRRTRTPPDE